ncbi:MAG: Crp/Fnr family transcriptional regulator [Pseudomonadota bacterium]|jgi:CRP-like cAMP-binding protein
MRSASLCVTCPNRELGFCGALLESSSQSAADELPNWQRFLTARAGDQIATRNQTSGDVFVLCSGWAFRFLQLPDGRRQILNFLLPGDLLSVVTIFDKQYQFSAKAVTGIQLSGFVRSEILARCKVSPGIQSAIGRCCVEESRVAGELVSVLGQRSADQRIAYLFLHLMNRIRARSVVRDHRYPLPLRQQLIADAVGLTPVHVSRVLGLFRDRGICVLSDNVLNVLNPAELERIGAIG